VAGLLVLTGALAFAFRPRNGHPGLMPDRRALSAATVLATAAALVLAFSLNVPPNLGWFAFGAMVAAFLLGGSALRPRGSRARGLWIGVAAYLMAGVVSVLSINQGFVGDLDALAWLIQVLAWPGLLFSVWGGFLGR
jgi:hypothetical protein